MLADSHGLTPLHIAAFYNCKSAMLHSLVDAGGDLNAATTSAFVLLRNHNTDYPVKIVAVRTACCFCVVLAHLYGRNQGSSPLHCAALNNSLLAAKVCLLSVVRLALQLAWPLLSTAPVQVGREWRG
jgi:ankyrin repeat protein